jgi:uncharacterized protein with HEPN domain
MKRDDAVYLHHILDAIGLIEEYTKGMSENKFLANSMAHDAVVRQIEIIGEDINYAIVWDTVRDDLPGLKKSMKKIIK